MKKVLVTGVNGYLGQGIVKMLLDNNCEVIATDRELSNVDIRAKKIPADLFEIKDPYDFFEKPDILLHLLWKDGFIHNSESHIFELPKHYEFKKNG